MGDSSPLTWNQMKGRNGWEPPTAVPADMGTEAINVVLRDGSLPERRPGAELVTTGGDTWADVVALRKYVPPTGLVDARLLLVSLSDSPNKMIALTPAFVGTALTLTDAVSANPQSVHAAQLHGKLFLAYKSGKNRLHVWDPVNAPTLVTRSGLPPPVAPTCADTGSGSYTATQRWYAVSARTKAGAIVLAQSERGPGLAFTPSGSGTAARVTRPATVETETHWVLWASAVGINGPYYQLTEVAIGTSTYDDSAAPSTYNLGTAEPVAGSYLCFPSVKYLVSDGTRLYGLGVWEATDVDGNSLAPVPGRVYITPVIGSTGRGDDERIESTVLSEGWIDLAPGGAGSEDRGLGGPINGEVFAFQSKGIFRLIPTGQAANPLARIPFSPHVGALSHESIVLAEDETGNPAIYFLNPEDGPRRITSTGQLQWLGRDVDDLWAVVNQNAATVKAWGLFDAASKRVMWWVSTGSADTPSLILTFDVTHGELQSDFVVRKGWTQWQGNAATWISGVMFPRDGNTETPMGGGVAGVLARLSGTRTHDYGLASGPQGYNQKVACYTGNGLPRTITCGFRPQAILIQPLDITGLAANDASGALWIADMGTDATLELHTQGATPGAGLVTSVAGNGFTLGVSDAVNRAGVQYSYLAFGDTVGTTFRAGSFISTGANGQAVTVSAGFHPTLAWAFGTGITGGPNVRDSNMGGNSIATGAATSTAHMIESLDANGFTVGSNLGPTVGSTVYYLCWQHDGGGLLASYALKLGSFAGTGLGVTATSGFGVPPSYVSVLLTGVTFPPNWRAAQPGGTHSQNWKDGATQSAAIASFTANGFTLGPNWSPVGQTIYWHAFGPGVVATNNP